MNDESKSELPSIDPTPDDSSPPDTAGTDAPHRDASEANQPKEQLADPPTKAQRSFRPRFGMLTMMLFAGVVCVWSMYLQLLRVNPEIASQVEAMTLLSKELILDDLEKISIARQVPNWYDDAVWQVYIPEGQSFRLALATREIPELVENPGEEGPSAADETVLTAGTHKIQLKRDNEGPEVVITVLIDDRPTLQAMETREGWDSRHGSAGGAQYDRPSQPNNDQVITLFRRRFLQDKGGGKFNAPVEPTNGIELRLERQ